jgi:peptide/nickel transport system permease protein
VLIVYASLGVANAILLEAGLSFLGLGVQPPKPSRGNMLNVARNVSVLEQYPWQWIPAGVAIVVTVLAVTFIGDGLRDAFDPPMKVRPRALKPRCERRNARVCRPSVYFPR